MTSQLYQVTDSKIIFTFPITAERLLNETDYKFVLASCFEEAGTPLLSTTGGELFNQYRPIPDRGSVINDAWQKLGQSIHQNLVDEAKSILTKIYNMIQDFDFEGFDLGNFSPIYASDTEDGAILIEWVFNNFRVGFNIEPDSADSGWYLVSNEKIGAIGASGFLNGFDSDNIILWLLNFIISNS